MLLSSVRRLVVAHRSEIVRVDVVLVQLTEDHRIEQRDERVGVPVEVHGDPFRQHAELLGDVLDAYGAAIDTVLLGHAV